MLLSTARILLLLIPAFIYLWNALAFSLKTPFWYDELVPRFLISDPSFFHMLRAYADQTEGSFPLYFLVGWPWVKLFGSSEVSLRMFSAGSIVAAYLLLYSVLRRIHGFWIAWLACSIVLLSTTDLWVYGREGRMYGLYVLVCVLGIYALNSINRTDRPAPLKLLGLALTHGIIALSHPFGIFFSTAIGGAALVYDMDRRRFRWRVHCAMPAGWLLLAPWIPGYLRFTQIMKTDWAGWIPKPGLDNLLAHYDSAFYFPAWALAAGIIVLTFIFLQQIKNKQIDTWLAAERNLCVIALFFLCIPAVVWAISQGGKSLYLSRVLVPCYMAYPILLAAMASVIRSKMRMGGAIVFLLAAGTVAFFHPSEAGLKLNPIPKIQVPLAAQFDISAYNPHNLPVVSAGHSSDAVNFLSHWHYAPEEDKPQFIYLSDPLAAKGLKSTFMDLMMNALGRNYLPDNVRRVEEFIQTHRSFLVLQSLPWFSMRFEKNPNFSTTQLRSEKGKSLILVQRKSN